MTYPDKNGLEAFLGLATDYFDTVAYGDWLVDGVIDYVERVTGRVFVIAGDTTVTFPAEAPYLLKGKRRLMLYRDIASVTTLTNGDGTVIASTDYRLISSNMSAPYYAIELKKSYDYKFGYGSDGTEISVLGKFGYSETCPDDLFDLLLRLMAHFFRQRQQGQGGTVTTASRRGGIAISPSTLPDDLKERLRAYKR